MPPQERKGYAIEEVSTRQEEKMGSLLPNSSGLWEGEIECQ